MTRLIPIDDYNSRIPDNHNIIGTVLPSFGNNALRNGWKLLIVYEETNTDKHYH